MINEEPQLTPVLNIELNPKNHLAQKHYKFMNNLEIIGISGFSNGHKIIKI